METSRRRRKPRIPVVKLTGRGRGDCERGHGNYSVKGREG
jgi:hypothetical protein